MARQIENIPDSLRSLLPSENTECVLIGSTAYEMLPLSEDAFEELVGLVWAFLRDLTSRTENESDIEVLVKGKRVQKFLSKILDMSEQEIGKQMTLKQVLHAAGVLYKQNFDWESLPENTRKNLQPLRDRFFPQRKQEIAEPVNGINPERLRILLESDSRTEIPKEDLLRLIASLDRSSSSEGTNSSPISTGGDTNTVAESTIGNVTSLMGRAGTGNSGKKYQATAQQIREFREKKLSSTNSA